MAVISYPNKDKTQSDDRKKWKDTDANEVKSVVNTNASAADAHISSTSNPHTVTKAQVGLSNVDNTSDANKPVSTDQQTALNLKADASALSSHTGNTSNPHSVTKTQVGLGNADNTSDASKPVSTATQNALNLKADSSTLTAHTGNTSNPHSVTKTQVGLGNADNIATAAVDTTGTAIAFATPQIYGSEGAPETGNITINTTGLVKGMTQLLIHNNGSEPTYAASIKIIGGAYATGTLNYIYLMAVSTTRILVTISQEV